MDDKTLNEKLDKITEKLDKVVESVNDVKIVQVQQKSTLDYHVHRTDLAEENIELLRQSQEEEFDKVYEQIGPLKSFQDKLLGAVKLLVISLSGAGVIIGAIKFFISH